MISYHKTECDRFDSLMGPNPSYDPIKDMVLPSHFSKAKACTLDSMVEVFKGCLAQHSSRHEKPDDGNPIRTSTAK